MKLTLEIINRLQEAFISKNCLGTPTGCKNCKGIDACKWIDEQVLSFKLIEKICANEMCGKKFYPNQERKIFCSKSCSGAQKQREYRRRQKGE